MNRRRILPVASLLLLLLCGCRSHVVVVTITNHSGAALHNLEFDYPGGSFGKAELADGAQYTYRIKTLREGNVSTSYEDADGKVRHQKGPNLQANSEGALEVEVTPTEIRFARP